MSKRTVQSEFPDYDAEFVLLDGFEDSSWCDDVCPSQEKELPDGRRLRLWCDYTDETLREKQSHCQYVLDVTDDNDETGYTALFESDDLTAVRDFLSTLSI